MGLIVILQRGRYVEQIKAPEHRPYHRGYNKASTNRLGVDAEWNSDEIY